DRGARGDGRSAGLVVAREPPRGRGLSRVQRPAERRGASGHGRPRTGPRARREGGGVRDDAEHRGESAAVVLGTRRGRDAEGVGDLLDDLEAGELSVELEGQEPQEVLEWALQRFSPRIAVSTAFQVDGVALIDMAYELDPSIQVFSVDTGRLPEHTFELIERLRDRYPGLDLQLLAPDPRQVQAMVARHGPNLFYRQVERRLL